MTLTSNSFGNGEGKPSPLKKMKIKILRNTRVAGKFAGVGSVVEIDDKDGKYLIANNIAAASTGKVKSKKADRSEGLSSSDIKVENRD